MQDKAITAITYKHEGLNRLQKHVEEEEYAKVLGQPDHRWYTSAAVASMLKWLNNHQTWLLDELHAQLDARLELLEATALRYEGVWERNRQHGKNAVVTHRGTIWCCQSSESTLDEPGTSPAWKMMAKSPQAARAKT